ncbi:MAG: SHOCT domain-containing protein [Sulfobacillus thermosulfidooxidans]|uniref:SHOCT domain-containing protein n=1 Tax=Sulfobacillus thermosulfidooxidans TaxID=28034 RepID=A0A2T2WFR3_SULTH|nr:MAG: SHOCT domain-containing protein [Sulfobacillus thermosulfidooxidans]
MEVSRTGGAWPAQGVDISHARRDVGIVPMMIGWGWVFPLFGMVMMVLVGWALVTRVVNGHQWGSSNGPPPNPLDLARERYAQGLISKPEFERLVEDLLHTEHHDTELAETFRRNRGSGPGCGPSGGAGCGGGGTRGTW